MRHLNRITFLLAAALLASACAQKAPAVDVAAEAQAVRDRSAEWLKLAQAKDVAAIASGVYAPDAVTLFDGEIHHGSEEIRAGMEAQFAAAPDMTVSWTTTDVRVAASGDMAVETGTWTFDTDGDGEAVPTNGEFVTVWVKTDGAWRAVADAGTQQKAVEPAEPGAGAAT